MRDPLRPPKSEQQSEIIKAAGRLERLKRRRADLRRRLTDLDGEILQAKRALRAVVADATEVLGAEILDPERP